MKVVTENHEHRDAEKLREIAKRIYEQHTVRCSCGAKLHYNDGSIRSLGFNKHVIECPCCHTNIPVSPCSIYSENKGDSSIQVLEEGNYHKDIVCDNCESRLEYDYRDVKFEVISIGDYYSSKSRYFIKCPVCGKNLTVKG